MLTAGLLFSLNIALLGSVAWRNWADNNCQFFPFAISFFHSTDAITLLTTTSLFLLYFACILIKTVLFGSARLRLVEEEHLREWGWMTASESLLAMTVFRNQFDAAFIMVFAVVLAVKAVHWVAKDRLEMFEQSARLPDRYHLRMTCTLIFLFVTDILGLVTCVLAIINYGPSMAILFASDFTILLIGTGSMSIKYAMGVHESNARQIHGNENYEMHLYGLDRSTLLFYFDFWVDLCKLSVYMIFFMAIILLYGLPLHLFRELYLTIASFVKRVQDVIKYRQATENMNSRYPDAKEEDLERVHHLCIICRDELKLGATGRNAKVLNCGHSFHFKCLRSWLERQQACPTCRRNVFDKPVATESNVNAATTHHNVIRTNSINQTSPSPINNEFKDSIDSLKKQMEELQRNVSETSELIRSMSSSLAASSNSFSASASNSFSASPLATPTITINDDEKNDVLNDNINEDENM